MVSLTNFSHLFLPLSLIYLLQDLDRQLRKLNRDKGQIDQQIVNLTQGITALSQLKLEVTIHGELRVCDFEREFKDLRVICLFFSLPVPFCKKKSFSLGSDSMPTNEGRRHKGRNWEGPRWMGLGGMPLDPPGPSIPLDTLEKINYMLIYRFYMEKVFFWNGKWLE